MDEHDLHTVTCPWCLETIEMPVEPGAETDRWVEDCPVCCHPMELELGTDAAGTPCLSAERSH
jgi:hypothetical protein